MPVRAKPSIRARIRAPRSWAVSSRSRTTATAPSTIRSAPTSLRTISLSGSTPMTRNWSARPAFSMVAAQRSASRPEASPLQTVRFGPPSLYRMAISEAMMLLEALGLSIGLVPRDVSFAMVVVTRQTVSTLP